MDNQKDQGANTKWTYVLDGGKDTPFGSLIPWAQHHSSPPSTPCCETVLAPFFFGFTRTVDRTPKMESELNYPWQRFRLDNLYNCRSIYMWKMWMGVEVGRGRAGQTRANEQLPITTSFVNVSFGIVFILARTQCPLAHGLPRYLFSNLSVAREGASR